MQAIGLEIQSNELRVVHRRIATKEGAGFVEGQIREGKIEREVHRTLHTLIVHTQFGVTRVPGVVGNDHGVGLAGDRHDGGQGRALGRGRHDGRKGKVDQACVEVEPRDHGTRRVRHRIVGVEILTRGVNGQHQWQTGDRERPVGRARGWVQLKHPTQRVEAIAHQHDVHVFARRVVGRPGERLVPV